MELESLAIKVSRSENLPVLPQIVSQVLKLADDPESSPKALERIIERDPAITAKILRVANSAYYGLHSVPSVSRAISVLGMNTIRQLVVGIAYQQMISGRQSSQQFQKTEFWKHSLAVAIGSRILGKIKMPLRAEELYGAGMMHDVGMLVLDRFCPTEFDQALKSCHEENIPLHEAEQFLYEFDHAVIGGLLAEKWRLTGIMSNAIRYHHEPTADEKTAESTYIIHAADVLANRAGISNHLRPMEIPLDPAAEDYLGLPSEQYEVIMKVMSEEVARAQQAFGID